MVEVPAEAGIVFMRDTIPRPPGRGRRGERGA